MAERVWGFDYKVGIKTGACVCLTHQTQGATLYLGVQGGAPACPEPPFSTPGRLVDALKSYEVIFYLAGSEVVLAGLFMAVATNCCLRRSRGAPPRPGTEGGARDSGDAEAQGDPEPLPTQEPSGPEALELLSPEAGPSEPEAEPVEHRSVGWSWCLQTHGFLPSEPCCLWSREAAQGVTPGGQV